jgi:Flp pilus assembly protein TadD
MSAPASENQPVDIGEMVRGLEDKIDQFAQRINDDQAEAIYATGYHLLQQGQPERAVRVFEMVTFFRPDDARYWYALGICCRRLDDPQGAAEALTEAVERNPDDAQPALLLVETLMLLGEHEVAGEFLDAVAEAAEDREDHAALVRVQGLRELIARPLQ